jgi:hypothetical protein
MQTMTLWPGMAAASGWSGNTSVSASVCLSRGIVACDAAPLEICTGTGATGTAATGGGAIRAAGLAVISATGGIANAGVRLAAGSAAGCDIAGWDATATAGSRRSAVGLIAAPLAVGKDAATPGAEVADAVAETGAAAAADCFEAKSESTNGDAANSGAGKGFCPSDGSATAFNDNRLTDVRITAPRATRPQMSLRFDRRIVTHQTQQRPHQDWYVMEGLSQVLVNELLLNWVLAQLKSVSHCWTPDGLQFKRYCTSPNSRSWPRTGLERP